jgi:hypothetical protein
MASTRNNNTQGNYNLQQKAYGNSREYIRYENSYTGRAYNVAMPAIGYNPSRMPSDNFSHNPVEIENFLLGINSTNLVNPAKEKITPELKSLPTYSYFDRIQMQLPNPLVIEQRQRPLFE